MAIISSVTFLFRLCLCTTDPQSEVELEGGKPKGLMGHPWLWPLPGFNCGILMGHHPCPCVLFRWRGVRFTGRRVGWPLGPGLHVSVSSASLHLLLSSQTYALGPTTGHTEPRTFPEHRASRSPSRWKKEQWHQFLPRLRGQGGQCLFTQSLQFTHTDMGRDGFQNYGNKCYFFPLSTWVM